MEKKQCLHCQKEFEGHTIKQVDYQIKQHMISKHPEKVEFNMKTTTKELHPFNDGDVLHDQPKGGKEDGNRTTRTAKRRDRGRPDYRRDDLL